MLLHVVFSTKDRTPWLQSPEIREHLNAYMVGTLSKIGCPSLIVNGVEDHLHCLCQLSRTMTIAELVESMKTSSSSWLKQQDPNLKGFYWQAGYGAFSVGQTNVDQVRAYIANQAEHHRKATYQDEFRGMLQRAGVMWDERFVWE